jgi:hypothetical protein
MIPINITREYIVQAINEIKKNGMPNGRESRKYVLEYERLYYPPKYTIALANKYANGEILSSQLFNGGYETNSFLRTRGFTILLKDKKSSNTARLIEDSRINQDDNIIQKHKERCSACKANVHKLLLTLYGNVEKNKNLGLGSRLEDYQESPAYPVLERIYHALQEYRGHTNFVNTDKLPPCDFFIPDPATIVEYDERQHFSKAREITLSLYPEETKTQFDIGRWKGLCRRIIAEDNSPIYRDEQRAWYDTLRDFAPIILKIHPTVRLLDNERKWCDMNENNMADVKEFERRLLAENRTPKISIRIDQNPDIARLIISGPWSSDIAEAGKVLERLCELWPKDVRAKYFITCGGFLSFPLPNHLKRKARKSLALCSEENIREIREGASRVVIELMSGGLRERLAEHTDFVTIGIDSEKTEISTTQTPIKQTHAELVFLIGLKDNEYFFTGKSYPTTNQQRTLLRISDLSSHFPGIPGSPQLMILGCHDLAIFSPRSENAKGRRRALRDSFREIAKMKKPSIVLQHPHTADSVWTWKAMWNKMEEMLPSVRLYAGAGRYYNKSEKQRSSLESVLVNTKRGASIDFIVNYDS